MPVGCLGGKNMAENGQKMDVIMTSSSLNAADQFAFMQQTLLMQIFRLNQNDPKEEKSSNCPTCIAFSDRCCQENNGNRIFQEFIEANLHYCVWDQNSSDALYSLRYQGYVCPGIMVMIANSSHLELMADLWKRQLLTAPRGTRISQVGLSTGCVVRPVPVSHSVSLNDVLCLILARLKQRGQVADMKTIIESVNLDWSSLVNRMKSDGSGELRDNVHSALGSLIKQRKVYYTGNKGYFLVGPAENSNANGCTATLFNNGSNLTNGIGTKFSHLRHSMRERSSSSTSANSNNNSPDSSISSSSPNTNGEIVETKESSSESSFNLERSQSLRISKKSLRSLSSKGGSLRLSKKEAANALKQVKEETSENDSPQPSKSFERKNSFLSKLFNSSSASDKSPKVSKKKPILATFSAQFPPPEITAKNGENAIYQQLIPASQRPPRHPNQMQKMEQMYGYSMIQQKMPENMYQAPPPPLPYRPPPPNPYAPNNGYVSNSPSFSNSNGAPYVPNSPSFSNSNAYVSNSPSFSNSPRPSPTNMRLSPSPPITTNAAIRASPSSSGASTVNHATYARVSNLKKTSVGNTRNHVRFALDEEQSSSGIVTSSSSTSSSSSGPSSLESQKNNLYDETLVVIEKSNKELEKKLERPNRIIDTIHNNKNSLTQEVIYEVETEETQQRQKAPSYPSLNDLSIAEISTSFKSITAQKLMAGLSFNSIDTLLEVNAAAEARSKLNESTETVDFGII